MQAALAFLALRAWHLPCAASVLLWFLLHLCTLQTLLRVARSPTHAVRRACGFTARRVFLLTHDAGLPRAVGGLRRGLCLPAFSHFFWERKSLGGYLSPT